MGVEGEMDSAQDVELGEVKSMLRGVLEDLLPDMVLKAD